MTGCNEVEFNPTIEAKPTTNLADSPTGLEFDLKVPQNNDPDGAAVAHLRDTQGEAAAVADRQRLFGQRPRRLHPSQIGYHGLSDERQFFHFDSDFAESFSLGFGGATTAPLPASRQLNEVAAALESLPGLAGNVKLDGAPGGWVVTFVGALAGTDVPELTRDRHLIAAPEARSHRRRRWLQPPGGRRGHRSRPSKPASGPGRSCSSRSAPSRDI